MPAATYSANNQFLITGSYAEEFPASLVIKHLQGVDNPITAPVVSAVYDLDSDSTVVTVDTTLLTINLVEVQLSYTACDPVSGFWNLCDHNHSSQQSGGEHPFGLFTDADAVNRLLFVSAVSAPVALGLIGVNETGDDLVRYYVEGTANQVVVTQVGGFITLSLPQSIATTSSPTFVTETLTGLEGVVVAGTGGLLTSSLPSTATDVFQGDYSWVAPTLNWLVDVVLTNLQHDDVLHYKANLGHWVNEPANYETSPAARVTIGTILALMED